MKKHPLRTLLQISVLVFSLGVFQNCGTQVSMASNASTAAAAASAVACATTTTVNAALSTVLAARQMRIVLTWTAAPLHHQL